MYTTENTHRFPALVLALGFTTAVMIGLSALAHSQAAVTVSDVRQDIASMPCLTESVDTEPMIAPLRVDVIAYRSQIGSEVQTVAVASRSKQRG